MSSLGWISRSTAFTVPAGTLEMPRFTPGTFHLATQLADPPTATEES